MYINVGNFKRYIPLLLLPYGSTTCVLLPRIIVLCIQGWRGSCSDELCEVDGDELSFQEGDKLVVLTKTGQPDGWMKSAFRGREDLVPMNYGAK